MALIFLTGPSAAGKSTIAALIAHRTERGTVVDADAIRNMFAKPHRRAP
jgi:2-phosphoglycerate kinase